jgi:PAS domain S-box-containing protein
MSAVGTNSTVSEPDASRGWSADRNLASAADPDWLFRCPSACLIAVVAVVAVLAMRLALFSWIGPTVIHSMFLLAVVFAAWFGGFRPAVLAVVLSLVSLAVIAWIEEPADALWSTETLLGFALFALAGVATALIAESLHASRRKFETLADMAQEQAGRLRIQVEQRQAVEEQLRRLNASLEERIDDEVRSRIEEHQRLTDEVHREAQDRAAAERRFQGIFDSMFQFIGLLSPDGKVVEANRAALNFAGVERAAVIGKPFENTPWWNQSEETQARLRESIRRAAQGECIRYEVVNTGANGTTAIVDFSLTPLLNDAGEVEFIIPEGRDITGIREMQAQLEESEERFRTFMNCGAMLAWIKDENLALQYVNDNFNAVFPPPEGGWIGREDFLFDLPEYAEEIRRRDREVLERQEVMNFIEGCRTPDGTDRSWLIVKFPFQDRHGARYVGGVALDVTDRVQIEKQLSEYARNLEDSNRELERFAYVASHDLQEPLRTVSSYLELLKRRYEGQLDERADKYIEYSVQAATRMRSLIQGLLRYSRLTSSSCQLSEIDSAEVAQEVVDTFRHLVDSGRAVISMGTLPRVWFDRMLFTQVLQNLVGNAIKFCESPPAQVDISAERCDGAWQFVVSDAGIGIEPQHLTRIFDLFQRLNTSDRFDGTGLGLAICERIIHRHGGRIWAESTPGEGSRFYFTIPDHPARTA